MKLKIKKRKFWATRANPDKIKVFTLLCNKLGISIQDAFDLFLDEFIKQNTEKNEHNKNK